MIADLEHPSHHHTLQPCPRPEHPFDLDPLPGDQLRQLVGLKVGGGELPQPGEDDLHTTPSNCSRNCTSPSRSIRMSGIAYLSSATRSMPIPKANPV